MDRSWTTHYANASTTMIKDYDKIQQDEHNSSSLIWFSLQHFAKAEDEGRTEEPTDRKKRKSRKEGKVAKSADLAQAVTMLVALFTFAFLGRRIILTLGEMMHFYFSQVGEASDSRDQPFINHHIGIAFFRYYFRAVGVIFATTFLAAFIAMAGQVGFVYSKKAIKVDFKKVAPNFAKYINKTFLSIEAMYNLAKSIFKVIIIGFVGYITISSTIKRISIAPLGSMTQTVQFLLTRIFVMVFIVAIFLLALAVIDYLFQKHQLNESLKMTKQEIKDEVKEDMGNPQVKSLIRQRMMELMRSSMIQNVPKADVIITNPTHFSIALEYTWGAPAPRVTAKGEDLIALKIREIAQANGVPLVENRPLARALYASVEIGDEVPDEYLKIVADILASLPKIQARMRGV
ncbi:flagellar biosynthesis protein FlhB [Entomospira entomophila]|uniref:Flagellar biosynthetic protein FlhB n=1 Tax=Entomospira entomophila TaxID=2719988 RepID=A0A968G8G8_9SPIO|nr:flagellar biosynthesis protein FlhB [Entomospira entomophilus]NIZ40490.1 flagellar biosynthesis protein FlhB [Entomospira entomophilus]WDI36048.1 flagellar biosynthesis protein FlhB [Entomospira entomophilus]